MSKKLSGKARYIVTFANPETDVKSASSILNVSASSLKDGATLMAEEHVVSDSDLLYFDGLATASMPLSEKDAEQLRQNENVLAVEEDIEVFALEGMDDDSEIYDESDSVQDHELLQAVYEQGYNQAIADVMMDQPIDESDLAGVQYTPNPDSPYPLPPFPWGGRRRPIWDRFPIPPIPIRWPVVGPDPSPIDRFRQIRLAALARPTLSPVSPIFRQAIPWNMQMIHAPGAWARGYRGDGIKVAVLDTGIAHHPDLVISGGVSFVDGVSSYNDGNGHGTHCAGIIGARDNSRGVIGVAPKCKLYAVKVLSDSGRGYMSWILAGMSWAKRNKMNVVSMSLGSETVPSVAYTSAIKELNTAGIVVVCAAGNSKERSFPWVNAPANCTGAIAVAAVDRNKQIAYFSSRGAKPGVAPYNQVTLSSPGVKVNSTWMGGGYKELSGTSMACPHVAGAVALILQRRPGISPAQVKKILISTASDLGAPGRDITFGAGLLHCERAVI